jgi:hypothetical protein
LHGLKLSAAGRDFIRLRFAARRSGPGWERFDDFIARIIERFGYSTKAKQGAGLNVRCQFGNRRASPRNATASLTVAIAGLFGHKSSQINILRAS